MYSEYNPNPKKRLVGDCVIRALTKLLHKSWDDVYIDLAIEGYKAADMPSANHVWGKYIEEHGYKKMLIPDTCPDCYTIEQFCRDHKEGYFLVATGSHVGNDGGAWWILILFLFAFMGNGNGWGGYGGGNGAVPYLNADLQRGFDQQAVTGQIANLQAQVGNGFADNAVAQCQGNANTVAAITGAKDALNSTLYANQLANNQAMNSIAMSLQNCCCENRANIADLKYTVATENCQDRQALSDGLRDLMVQNTANTQAIVNSQQQGFQAIQDKLCQLELDSYKQKVSDQAAEIASLRGQVSQTAQTAAIIANNEAQTANLLQRLNPAPVPAYTVANPNCCGYNSGCGCA